MYDNLLHICYNGTILHSWLQTWCSTVLYVYSANSRQLCVAPLKQSCLHTNPLSKACHTLTHPTGHFCSPAFFMGGPSSLNYAAQLMELCKNKNP